MSITTTIQHCDNNNNKILVTSNDERTNCYAMYQVSAISPTQLVIKKLNYNSSIPFLLLFPNETKVVNTISSISPSTTNILILISLLSNGEIILTEINNEVDFPMVESEDTVIVKHVNYNVIKEKILNYHNNLKTSSTMECYCSYNDSTPLQINGYSYGDRFFTTICLENHGRFPLLIRFKICKNGDYLPMCDIILSKERKVYHFYLAEENIIVSYFDFNKQQTFEIEFTTENCKYFVPLTYIIKENIIYCYCFCNLQFDNEKLLAFKVCDDDENMYSIECNFIENKLIEMKVDIGEDNNIPSILKITTDSNNTLTLPIISLENSTRAPKNNKAMIKKENGTYEFLAKKKERDFYERLYKEMKEKERNFMEKLGFDKKQSYTRTLEYIISNVELTDNQIQEAKEIFELRNKIDNLQTEPMDYYRYEDGRMKLISEEEDAESQQSHKYITELWKKLSSK